ILFCSCFLFFVSQRNTKQKRRTIPKNGDLTEYLFVCGEVFVYVQTRCLGDSFGFGVGEIQLYSGIWMFLS
ncbi:MAG: hypothetical protein J6X43_03695, partial [Bacteroidales bacterium]|nr:hypothetical protein [Bacteroidales bacterium]